MPVVSLTRLRLRRFWYLPVFFRHANASAAQLKGMPGFIGGYLASNWKWTFWTVSVWESHQEMRAYRGSGAHAVAMRRLPKWCDEAAVATIDVEQVAPPSPIEITRVMQENGRLTWVNKPSQAHTARKCWTDGRVPKVVQRITPA